MCTETTLNLPPQLKSSSTKNLMHSIRGQKIAEQRDERLKHAKIFGSMEEAQAAKEEAKKKKQGGVQAHQKQMKHLDVDNDSRAGDFEGGARPAADDEDDESLPEEPKGPGVYDRFMALVKRRIAENEDLLEHLGCLFGYTVFDL